MLGDFTVKSAILIGKENPYLTENWLSKKEMWCAVGNYIMVCVTHVQMNF